MDVVHVKDLNLEELVSMFKKLLMVVTLLGVPTAFAEPVAFMPNNSGGKIVMTNDECTGKEGKKYEGLFRIYTYSKSGDTSEGCFTFEGDTIRVFWPDAKKEARYEIGNFELYKK